VYAACVLFVLTKSRGCHIPIKVVVTVVAALFASFDVLGTKGNPKAPAWPKDRQREERADRQTTTINTLCSTLWGGWRWSITCGAKVAPQTANRKDA